MKLTKSQLKQLIKEELQKVLKEQQTPLSRYEQEARPSTSVPPTETEEWPFLKARRPQPGAAQQGPATADLQQKILDSLAVINASIRSAGRS